MKLYVEDEEGDAVWVKATLPRPPEQYEPGLVVDAVVRGRPMSVKLPPEEMYQQEGLDMENCDDLCDLGHVHEASILDTIQERAHCSKPYTAAGDVVVAVNPFRWLKLYTPELRALHSAPPNSYEERRAAHTVQVRDTGLQSVYSLPLRAAVLHSKRDQNLQHGLVEPGADARQH